MKGKGVLLVFFFLSYLFCVCFFSFWVLMGDTSMGVCFVCVCVVCLIGLFGLLVCLVCLVCWFVGLLVWFCCLFLLFVCFVLGGGVVQTFQKNNGPNITYALVTALGRCCYFRMI